MIDPKTKAQGYFTSPEKLHFWLNRTLYLKRMKHELSFFFNTNPTTGAILYPSHRKVSPTWTRDMCTLLWGTRLRTSILENHKLQSIPESRNGLVHLLVIIVETVNILVADLPPRHSVDHLHCI